MSDTLSTVWGETTDPTKHDPTGFRYLVHLDTGFSRLGSERKYFLDDLSRIANPTRRNHPRSKKQMSYLSTSLIDQELNPVHIWGRHGMILEVDASDVLATSAIDLWIGDIDLDELMEEECLTAEQIMEATSPLTNNEIVIRPTNICVRGLIAFESPRYDYHNRWKTVEELEEKSEVYSLPLVIL